LLLILVLNVSKEVILPSKNGPQISHSHTAKLEYITIEENSFTSTLIGTFSTFENLLNKQW
jgi:hypothetical protein